MIVILGGGISGLAAAYELQRRGKTFLLLEAKARLGGKIWSEKKGEFVLESGPNTVMINKLEVKQMLDNLGLSKDIIQADSEAVKNRFVVKNGQAEPIPNSLKTAFQSPLFGWDTFFHIMREPFVKANAKQTEESLADFSRRRFGKQIYEDFITPFITGIYAGDPEKMSVNHTLSILKQAEKKHGSVLVGMFKMMKEKKQKSQRDQLPKQKLFTFQNGLSHLIDTLEKEISEKIKKNAKVTRIQFNQSKNNYEINYLHNGSAKKLKADQVITSLPAPQLSELISGIDRSLAEKLKKINYAPAVVLHLSFPTSAVDFKQKAFGILSRKVEPLPFLGLLFNSRFFPHTAPKGEELITVICGGELRPEIMKLSDEALHREIDHSLKSIIGLKGESKILNSKRWYRGIPQYELGYADITKKIDSFQKEHKNFYIAGNFYEGISVSDCIALGVQIARKLN